MSFDAKSLVAAANKEWKYWGNSTWNVHKGTASIKHRDDDPAYAQYVLDVYCKFVSPKTKTSVWEIRNDDYPWSAVGMSYIVGQAGATKTEFPFSEGHSTYIRRFVSARKNKETAARFWAYRLTEPAGAPDVGDLVAYGRGTGMTFDKAQKLFDKTGSYASHTDLVVAKRAGEIDVIGANVLDSVTKKTLKIGADGHISDRRHHWFAVLKLR